MGINKNLLNFYSFIKKCNLSVLHGTNYSINIIFLMKLKSYMTEIIEYLFHFNGT